MTTKSVNAAPVNVAVPVAELAALSVFLEQAEVCCEQAREAAHLKRFRAALGLFSTASALCRHVALNGNPNERALACDALSSLALEMATYSDLAHSRRT